MYSEDHETATTALGSVRRAMGTVESDADLANLARSPEAKIRATVGEMVETPLTVLLKLAVDEAPAVRAAVGRNPRADLPLAVREALAADKAIEVQFGLLKCPTLPESILAKLTHASNRDVANAAKVRAKARKSSGGALPVLSQVGFASS